MIPVGTRVRMSALGRYVYGNSASNPHYDVGVVRAIFKGEEGYILDCLVEWDNGTTNTYDYNQLEVLIDFSTKSLEDYL